MQCAILFVEAGGQVGHAGNATGELKRPKTKERPMESHRRIVACYHFDAQKQLPGCGSAPYNKAYIVGYRPCEEHGHNWHSAKDLVQLCYCTIGGVFEIGKAEDGDDLRCVIYDDQVDEQSSQTLPNAGITDVAR